MKVLLTVVFLITTGLLLWRILGGKKVKTIEVHQIGFESEVDMEEMTKEEALEGTLYQLSQELYQRDFIRAEVITMKEGKWRVEGKALVPERNYKDLDKLNKKEI